MTHETEFAQTFDTVRTFSHDLAQFERDLTARPQTTVSQTLRKDFLQLQLRFSAIRGKYIARTVAAGLQEPGLREYHTQFRYRLRAFTHGHETLEDFMANVWKQLITQSYTFD